MTEHFATLRAANEALAAKSKTLHEIFAQAGEEIDLSKVTLLEGDTKAKAEKIKALNDELAAIGEERDRLRDVEDARRKLLARGSADGSADGSGGAGSGGNRLDDARPKSLGALFRESAEYRDYKGLRQWPRPAALPNFDIRNAVFRTGAGWDPQDIRLDRFEVSPVRPIAVVDNLPYFPTSESAIVYMEETTFTQSAVETAESTATTAADLIPEAALALTERSRNVEWLPVFLPVTMQQMEDQEGIEAYINQRLTYAIRARLDLQILQGNGTAPNLLGTNSVTGIQTQAKGTDPTPDAVYKLFTSIRSDGFAEPSVLFAHPNDWQDVRLLRTADGLYIWGSPMDAGPERIWGIPVVVTAAALQNTMTAGDYARYSGVFTKRGIEISVSDSHAFYFTRGMLAVRADMRVAVVHFRPKAFGTITGV